MIITHTQTTTGQRRLYIGGKGSLECYLTPTDDGLWTFHLDEAVTGNRLSDTDKRAWSTHMLAGLADELAVPPDALKSTPFETIAALHTADPYTGRRMPVSKRKAIDSGYITTPPTITRPQGDFRSSEYAQHRQH